MKKVLFSVLFLSLFSLQLSFADVSVTVYNNNRALVKETRDVNLKKGVQSLEFDNVAAQIDATSVLPKFLSDASKIKVLEQNFDYDLVSRDKLLGKYIGKEIEVERTGEDKRNKLSGTLLSVSGGGMVIQSANKIVVNPSGEVSMSKLPEGLRLKPTLVWLVSSDVEGAVKMEVSYQTGAINWNADYVLVTDENDTQADMTGWVTINNRSGATYKDAKLKLIAGDVNMVAPQRRAKGKFDGALMAKQAASAPSFEEKSFFEYHIYELQRKSTIKENEIKQIEFVTASKIPVKKVFTYNGAVNGQKVTVNLDFKNSKENNLGMPLPKGRVRVCKYDGDSLEFVGENMIDHTAKDAKLSLYIGNAFDITGERKQTDYRQENKSAYESFKITVKNSKNVPVEVNVKENMFRWSNWKIEANSAEYSKTDSNTAEFLVTVPAEGEKEITYTVKYWWK